MTSAKKRARQKNINEKGVPDLTGTPCYITVLLDID